MKEFHRVQSTLSLYFIRGKRVAPASIVTPAPAQCRWSRKGYMRTRWRIRGTVIDLVNIHLFHDASNLMAMREVSPLLLFACLLLSTL